MTRYERLRYEMFLRVRNFAVAHRHDFPDASTGEKAFDAVAAAVGEIEANATARRLTAGEGQKAKAAAREALMVQMARIARTARLIAKAVPGSDAAFHLRGARSDTALLTAGRAFIRECQPATDRFVRLGMPATFVMELQACVDGFERAIHARRVGRTRRAGAQAGIRTALARGLDAVLTLDVVVTNTLSHDPAVLAAWKRDRCMKRKARRQSTAASAFASAMAGGETAVPTQPDTVPASPAAQTSACSRQECREVHLADMIHDEESSPRRTDDAEGQGRLSSTRSSQGISPVCTTFVHARSALAWYTP